MNLHKAFNIFSVVIFLAAIVLIVALIGKPKLSPSKAAKKAIAARKAADKENALLLKGATWSGDLVLERKASLKAIQKKKKALPQRGKMSSLIPEGALRQGLSCSGRRGPCSSVTIRCSAEVNIALKQRQFYAAMSVESCNMYLPTSACEVPEWKKIKNGAKIKTKDLINIISSGGGRNARCAIVHESEHALQNTCNLTDCIMEEGAYSASASCLSSFSTDESCESKAWSTFSACRAYNNSCVEDCSDCKETCIDAMLGCSIGSKVIDYGYADKSCGSYACAYCGGDSCKIPNPTPSPTATPVISPTSSPAPTATPLPTATIQSLKSLGPCDCLGDSCGACGQTVDMGRLCACYGAAGSNPRYGGTISYPYTTCLCSRRSLEEDIAAAQQCLSSMNAAFSGDVREKVNAGFSLSVDLASNAWMWGGCW